MGQMLKNTHHTTQEGIDMFIYDICRAQLAIVSVQQKKSHDERLREWLCAVVLGVTV